MSGDYDPRESMTWNATTPSMGPKHGPFQPSARFASSPNVTFAIRGTRPSTCATWRSKSAWSSTASRNDYQRFLQERNRGDRDSDGRPDRSIEEIHEWAREHDL